MNSKIIFPLLIISLFSVTIYADVTYKWLDENGQVQYTQLPPPPEYRDSLDIVEINPNKKYLNVLKKDSSKKEIPVRSLEGEEKRTITSETAPEKVDDEKYKERLKEACASAERSLESYKNPRVNIKDKSGNYRDATEAERKAGIKRAEDAMKKYCK